MIASVRVQLAAPLLAALSLALAAPAAQAAISLTGAAMTPSDPRAGAHPDLTLTADIATSGLVTSGDDVRDLSIELPPGLIGNPRAVPRCSQQAFDADACPAATQVGTVVVKARAFVGFYYDAESGGSVYNLDPGPDEAGRLGLWVRPTVGQFRLEKFSFVAPVRVRPGRASASTPP